MIKSYLNFCIAALLSLSILLPTVWQPLKIIIFGFCLLFATLLLLKQSGKISRKMVVFSLIYVCMGLAWSLYGLAAGNPGSLSVMTVMVAYPLMLPLLAFCYEKQDKQKLLNLFVFCGIALVIFDISFISASIISSDNYLSNYIFEIYKDDAVIDEGDGYFKFTIPNISSCIFLLPYLLILLVNSNKSKLLLGSTVVMMCFIAILSGRRALFITPIFGVVLAYALTKSQFIARSKTNIPKKAKLFLLMFFVAVVLYLFMHNFYGVELYLEQINSIFDFSNNSSNIERKKQLQALLQGIYDAPLFGSGAGAAANYSRSDTQPWAYELSYIAFIFQYGVIGFIVYSIGIASLTGVLIFNINKFGRNTFEFAFLAGFISFLIANATNPYLGKFDYMWVIFIPYALLNKFLLNRAGIISKDANSN